MQWEVQDEIEIKKGWSINDTKLAIGLSLMVMKIEIEHNLENHISMINVPSVIPENNRVHGCLSIIKENMVDEYRIYIRYDTKKRKINIVSKFINGKESNNKVMEDIENIFFKKNDKGDDKMKNPFAAYLLNLDEEEYTPESLRDSIMDIVNKERYGSPKSKSKVLIIIRSDEYGLEDQFSFIQKPDDSVMLLINKTSILEGNFDENKIKEAVDEYTKTIRFLNHQDEEILVLPWKFEAKISDDENPDQLYNRFLGFAQAYLSRCVFVPNYGFEELHVILSREKSNEWLLINITRENALRYSAVVELHNKTLYTTEEKDNVTDQSFDQIEELVRKIIYLCILREGNYLK